LRECAAETAAATEAGRLHDAIVLNRRFHRGIAELSGNGVALRMLDRLWDQIQVSTLRSLRPPARPAHVSAQHDRLLVAIERGRDEEADRIAREHVLDTYDTTDRKG